MAFPVRDERPTRQATWATWGLIVLCTLVFAYVQPKPMQGFTHGLDLGSQARAELQERDFVDRWGLVPCEITHDRSITNGAACDGYPVDDPGAYAEKNIWVPLVTALFLHANLFHLLGNLLFLWVFGRGLEHKIGSSGTFALFIAGGIAASLGYIMIKPESATPLLGASGAIAALMGAALVIHPQRRILSVVYAAGLQVVYLPAWAVLGFFFASQFFTSQGTQVAWQAHVAGMGFGALVAIIWRWRSHGTRDTTLPLTVLEQAEPSESPSFFPLSPPIHPPS